MKATPYAIVLVAALLVLGCFEEWRGIEPTEPGRHTLAVGAKPDSGRIGSTVVIRNFRFVAGVTYSVTFPGADGALSVDCDSAAVIRFFVPFGAVSGPVTVGLGREKGVTGPFVVTEMSDQLGLTVSRYDITPPVTAKDSSVVNYRGDRRAWSAVMRGDTVHLSLIVYQGEVSYEYHFLLRNGPAGQLPHLMLAWTVMRPDYPGVTIDTLRAGLMKIQDWDTSGVMSGRFFGRPSARFLLNGTVAFWVTRPLPH